MGWERRTKAREKREESDLHEKILSDRLFLVFAGLTGRLDAVCFVFIEWPPTGSSRRKRAPLLLLRFVDPRHGRIS